MLTCGPCPIVDKSSLSTHSTVSAFLSDGPVSTSDYPANLYSYIAELGIMVLILRTNLKVHTCLALLQRR
jgi:hypothetical protein